MLAAGWGRIVTISSSSAQSGAPEHGPLRGVEGRRHRAHQGAGRRARPPAASPSTPSRRASSTRPMARKAEAAGDFPGVDVVGPMVPLGRAGTPGRHRRRLLVPVLRRAAATSPARSSASTAACTSEEDRPAGLPPSRAKSACPMAPDRCIAAALSPRRPRTACRSPPPCVDFEGHHSCRGCVSMCPEGHRIGRSLPQPIPLGDFAVLTLLGAVVGIILATGSARWARRRRGA